MRFFTSFFLATTLACSAFAQGVYKVKVAQVEYIRDSAYFPDTSQVRGVQIIDGSSFVHSIDTGISDHATQVLQRLVGGNASGLVASVNEIEAVTFTYRSTFGLGGGRSLDPASVDWDVENHSWGGRDPLWESNVPSGSTYWTSNYFGRINYIPGILTRESARLEHLNIIACIALPDPNMAPTRLLCAAQSRNIIKVGSAHGQVTTAEYTPDVIFQDPQADYTSYDCPDVVQTVIAMVSYLKTNGIAYNAGDVAQIVKDVAKQSPNLMHNHAACMAALYAKYPSVQPVPTITPAPTPVPTAVPTPTPTPTPTPVPTPTPDPRITIAATLGITYDPATQTFSGATSSQVKQLAAALQAQGL